MCIYALYSTTHPRQPLHTYTHTITRAPLFPLGILSGLGELGTEPRPTAQNITDDSAKCNAGASLRWRHCTNNTQQYRRSTCAPAVCCGEDWGAHSAGCAWPLAWRPLHKPRAKKCADTPEVTCEAIASTSRVAAKKKVGIDRGPVRQHRAESQHTGPSGQLRRLMTHAQ